MAMAFAILNSLGQINNLEKALNKSRIELNKVDESGPEFLEKLAGILESENEIDISREEELLETTKKLEIIEEILQDKDLDQSKEAALLVLLNQLGLLDIEYADKDKTNIQLDSLMAILDNLDELNVDEIITNLEDENFVNFDTQNDFEALSDILADLDISDINNSDNKDKLAELMNPENLEDLKNISDIMEMDIRNLDLSSVDNEFLELIQEFAQENELKIEISDLESQEQFTTKLLEILSGESGDELLANIKEEFSAEVRAMELFVDGNISEDQRLIDLLQIEAEKVVFEINEKVNLEDFANSSEMDINNILADNSQNLIETVRSELANDIKNSSPEQQSQLPELINSELISDELLKNETTIKSGNKIENLIEAMLVDSQGVDSVTGEADSQLAGQESFVDLMANITGDDSNFGVGDIGSQSSFGLDESVMEQLITEMEQFKQMGSNQLEMELEPSWLGKLRLNVSVEQGEVMARFLVDNNFIRHELENNIGLLKGSLVRQGFNIEQISIETRDQQAGWQNGDSQNFAEDFQGQEYNQEESAFNFNQEELAYYAEKAGELEGIDPNKMDPRMRRWLNMKQYYNSMNLLA